MREESKKIILTLIDNDFFKDQNISALTLKSLLMKRLEYYMKNCMDDALYEAPMYCNIIASEIKNYIDNLKI